MCSNNEIVLLVMMSVVFPVPFWVMQVLSYVLIFRYSVIYLVLQRAK